MIRSVSTGAVSQYSSAANSLPGIPMAQPDVRRIGFLFLRYAHTSYFKPTRHALAPQKLAWRVLIGSAYVVGAEGFSSFRGR